MTLRTIIIGSLCLSVGCQADRPSDPPIIPPTVPSADAGVTQPLDCTDDRLTTLYEHYVEPFVSGMQSTSCSECHMTGIDMSVYAQDTPCQTMACMVQSGAANLESPADSEILGRIMMGDPASSAFSVETEHAAILEWLEWSAQCHDSVCGSIEDPCKSGTGAPSTARTPTGNCSEEDLLVQYWDSVVVDRGRCISCHGQEDDSPATNFLKDLFEADWDNPEHRAIALTSMFTVITNHLIDKDEPLNSLLLTKPLQHGFRPFAVYGALEDIESVPEGVGTGVHHDGQAKITFPCPGFDCSEGAIMDCRTDVACAQDSECNDDQRCNEGFCRIRESVCDTTYISYLSFIQAYRACQD